jgi:hypothetical protein
MKVSDIYSLTKKTSITLKEVFSLSTVGYKLFPMHLGLNVNWDYFESSCKIFKAYKVRENFHVYYIIELDGTPFFIVDHEKVLNYYTPLCTCQKSYAQLMDLMILYSDYSKCSFLVDKSYEIKEFDDYEEDEEE